MTVKQLKEFLDQYPDDTPIVWKGSVSLMAYSSQYIEEIRAKRDSVSPAMYCANIEGNTALLIT